MSVLTLRQVYKSFGRVQALDGLDLDVVEGEVHGFLGPNGAGKTTALRVLLGLIRPDRGQSEILGGDPWNDAARLHRRLSYVPADLALWPNLTGAETIELMARLRGDLNRDRVRHYSSLFDFDASVKARHYSTGNRQKVALVSAFASTSELILMDEPTTGLDPLMEQVFQDCVREAAREGRTVVLSSHVLSEVEAVCDRVTIVRAGRTVETSEVATGDAQTHLEVDLESVPDHLESLIGVHDLQIHGSKVAMNIDPGAVDGVLRALVPAGIRTLSAGRHSLEQRFLQHYRASEDQA